MLPSNLAVMVVIIADQIKSLDWKVRNVEFIVKAPKNVLNETMNKFLTLVKL